MDFEYSKLMSKLFIISWIVYFTSYIGRLNYSASMLEIGLTKGYSPSQLGTIVTAFFISYGVGQFISGVLGDHYSCRRLVFCGLLGCSFCNLFVFFSTSFWQLVLSWFINGLALSLVWPPMIKLFSTYMPKDYLHKCCFNIQTSVALGTFFTYTLCALIIKYFNWKITFLCSSILLILIAFVWHKQVKSIETSAATYIHSAAASLEHALPQQPSSVKWSKDLLNRSGLLIILVAILIMGFLKDGVMTWVPQYVTDTFNTNSYFSIFLTAFLPLVNLSGIYIVKYISSKNKNDDLKTTILFYIVSMGSLILLVFIGKFNIYLCILLFSIVTSCMLGINTILISVLPVQFAKYNKTSTIAGLTNSVTYLGSALCGYTLGKFSQNYGWIATLIVLVITCILAILACQIARPLWRKFNA